MQNDPSRPVILYVTDIDTNPDIEPYLNTQRVSVLDIEIDKSQAQTIIDHLQARLAAANPGALRVRFTGRLVHL